MEGECRHKQSTWIHAKINYWYNITAFPNKGKILNQYQGKWKSFQVFQNQISTGWERPSEIIWSSLTRVFDLEIPPVSAVPLILECLWGDNLTGSNSFHLWASLSIPECFLLSCSLKLPFIGLSSATGIKQNTSNISFTWELQIAIANLEWISNFVFLCNIKIYYDNQDLFELDVIQV